MMKKRVLKSAGCKGLCGIALILLSPCVKARADTPIYRLNERNITTFINKTTDIALGRTTTMSEDQIRDYLDDHIEDEARFVSEMTYNIPGFPSQANQMAVDKGTYIENVLKTADTLADYEAEVTIEKIDISRDGTKATVFTKGIERGSLAVSESATDHSQGNAFGRDKSDSLPVDGQSYCTQILSLDEDENRIMMYHAKCQTTVNFEDIN